MSNTHYSKYNHLKKVKLIEWTQSSIPFNLFKCQRIYGKYYECK